MRKFIKTVVLVLVGLLILVFAVANRQTVVFTLDPLGSTDPGSPLAFSLPLFALALVLVIVGVMIGGVAAWLRQHKWRKAARELEAQVRLLKSENESLKQQQASLVPAAAEARPPALRLPAA